MAEQEINQVVNGGDVHTAKEEITDLVFSQQLSGHSSMPGTVETAYKHGQGEKHSQRHLEIHTAEIKTRIYKKDEVDEEGLSRQQRVNSSSIKTGRTERNLSKQFNLQNHQS